VGRSVHWPNAWQAEYRQSPIEIDSTTACDSAIQSSRLPGHAIVLPFPVQVIDRHGSCTAWASMATSSTRPRHLHPPTEDPRPRLSRLGHPEELTGGEPATQRIANELIAAERDLTDHQPRVLMARRDGDQDAATLAAARQRATTDRIDALRERLYTERRRALLQR
jgi:hypothetical protein